MDDAVQIVNASSWSQPRVTKYIPPPETSVVPLWFIQEIANMDGITLELTQDDILAEAQHMVCAGRRVAVVCNADHRFPGGVLRPVAYTSLGSFCKYTTFQVDCKPIISSCTSQIP